MEHNEIIRSEENLTNKREQKIPVILLDRSSVPAANLLNQNDWENNNSKRIVDSCQTYLGFVYYTYTKLEKALNKTALQSLCAHHKSTLLDQWNHTPFKIEKISCLAEVPEIHLSMLGFFSGIKSFLDLLVELLSTEQIIASNVHGFHEKGDKIIRQLNNNVSKSKQDIAKKMAALLIQEKEDWINDVIRIRDDLLVHPKKGLSQVLIPVHLKNQDKVLHVEFASPILHEEYFQKTAAHIENFTKNFLSILKPKLIKQ